MEPPPFPVHHDLDGWCLLWAELQSQPGGEEGLAELWARVAAAEVRHELDLARMLPTRWGPALPRAFRAL